MGEVRVKAGGRQRRTAQLPLLQTASPPVRASAVVVLDSFAEELRRGSVVLAQGYNGQLAKLVAEEPDKFVYVVPKEGATVWIDNVAIPAKAANPDAAHAFINYLLEPEIGARIVNAASYASANKAAREKIKPEILNNPTIYPPDDVLNRCEFMEHLGKSTAVEAGLWRQIKAE